MEAESNTQEIPIQKIKGILGLDPAFKNFGIAVIDSTTGTFVRSEQCQLRPFDRKLNQSEVEGFIANRLQQKLSEYFEAFDITHVVVELQLGQFSADKIQTAIICLLPQNVPYFIQHSKLKLKHKEMKEITVDNPNSKKYNQNKHAGRQLAVKLFPELESKSFDEYDSILHAKYVYDNMNKINWIKKSDLS